MSLYGALYSGVSGLSAQSSAMGAISDNISNVNTVGYKGAQVNFSTLVTKQVSLTNYSPGGVQSKPRSGVDVQGLLQASNSATDIALSGQGFFVVNEAANPGDGDMFAYTRAGSFKVDKEGYLQNVSGWYLQGWPLTAWDNSIQASTVQIGNNVYMKGYKDANGGQVYINDNIVDSRNLRPMNLNEIGGTASQTRNLRMGANLPNGATPGQTFKQPVTIYDSLGGDATINLNWTKTAQNKWDLSAIPPQGAKSLVLKAPSNTVYAAMGRLDFTAMPTSTGSFTMDIGGTPWTFNTTGGMSSGTTMYVDPATCSSVADFTEKLAAKIQQAYQLQYEAVTQAANASSGTYTSSLSTGSNVTITASDGTQYPYALAGLSPADAATAINAGTASHGITASYDPATGVLDLTNGSAAAASVTGSGDLFRLSGSIAGGGGTMATNANDLEVMTAATSITFDSTSPPTTISGAGLTRAGMIAAINAQTGTTGITAFQTGTDIALYANSAVSVGITAAGNMSAFNATTVTGTGRNYASAIGGTSALVFSNYDSANTIDITGLSSLTSGGRPATLQGGDPDHPDDFSVAAISVPGGTSTNAIEFNGDGTPSAINVTGMAIDWANGAKDMTGTADEVSLFFGNLNIRDGMTQLNGDYSLSYWSQNGAKFGNFAGVSIGADGIVTALFDNGVTRPVFQIPVSTFVNPNGMENLTGNVYISTDYSGEPTLRSAGSAGSGQVQSAALEASTVDIGTEFTTMIVTQRAYSAAAKIITTADQMLDELVQIKR